MTRERAKELAPIIAAYGEGKAIQVREAYTDNKWSDFIREPSWDENTDYRIKPSPQTRPMTRDEVLGKITSTVIRYKDYPWDAPWKFFIEMKDIEDYEWATITPEGVIGDPHKFEKEAEG